MYGLAARWATGRGVGESAILNFASGAASSESSVPLGLHARRHKASARARIASPKDHLARRRACTLGAWLARKGEGHTGADPELGLDGNATAVELHNGSHDRKTEPRPG